MRAIVLLLLLGGLWFVSGTARAGQYGCEGSQSCDEGEAYAACNVHAATMGGSWGAGTTAMCKKELGYYTICQAPGGSNCVSGSQWWYHFQQSCTQRNVTYPPGDMQPALAQPPSDCYGGCKLTGTSVTSAVGGITIYGVVNRTYTGEVCSKTNNANAPIEKQEEAKPNKTTECTALGNGQTACVKPNGDYCATASNGNTYCWTPTQEGAQVNGEHAQRKSAEGKPVTPPDVAIPDKDWQRNEGHKATACVNTTCTTYNVTNYSTVPAGTAKNSTGDNDASGNGNTSGNGKPSGNDAGNEDGEGHSATVGECGTPLICSGDEIMCAELREAHTARCETSEFRTGFINEIQGADTSDGTGTVDANTLWGTDEIGDVEMDTSGLGWGSSCPAPPEVFGHTMDWSKLCEMMGMVGLLILAVGHVHALYIFMGD